MVEFNKKELQLITCMCVEEVSKLPITPGTRDLRDTLAAIQDTANSKIAGLDRIPPGMCLCYECGIHFINDGDADFCGPCWEKVLKEKDEDPEGDKKWPST